jgi:hypothetical protein
MVTDGLRASAKEMLRLRTPKGESERAKAKGRRGA